MTTHFYFRMAFSFLAALWSWSHQSKMNILYILKNTEKYKSVKLLHSKSVLMYVSIVWKQGFYSSPKSVARFHETRCCAAYLSSSFSTTNQLTLNFYYFRKNAPSTKSRLHEHMPFFATHLNFWECASQLLLRWIYCSSSVCVGNIYYHYQQSQFVSKEGGAPYF